MKKHSIKYFIALFLVLTLSACATSNVSPPNIFGSTPQDDSWFSSEDRRYFYAAMTAIEKNDNAKAEECLQYVITKYPGSDYGKATSVILSLLDDIQSCEAKRKKMLSDIKQLKSIDIEAEKKGKSNNSLSRIR